VRKSLRNGKQTEKSDEYNRGVQTKNGKDGAAGEEQIVLHLYYITGRAGRRNRRTSLAVVAYKDGQLHSRMH